MKSGNITLGGILIALTIIILYSASILPVSTISVLTIASAIVDRLVLHSVIMNIKGKSYRIKDLVQEDFNEEKSS